MSSSRRCFWRSLCLLLTLPLTLTVARVAAAQQPADSQSRAAAPTYRFRMLGVYDDATGKPVDSVRVTDVLSGTFAMTGDAGIVSLFFLPEGVSLVRIQKLGYEVQMHPVTIGPGDTLPITLVVRRVTQLDKVVTTAAGAPTYISPGLRGFMERKKIENGYFLDEHDLRRNDGRPLGNVLKMKPAVNIVYASGSAMYLMKSPRCTNGGPPQVYLDGVQLGGDPPPPPPRGSKVQSTAVMPFDLSQFQVSELAAVEWYPGGEMVPIQFAHTSERCGALMLWTRER